MPPTSVPTTGRLKRREATRDANGGCLRSCALLWSCLCGLLALLVVVGGAVFGEKVAQDHSSSRGIGAYAFAYVSTYGLMVIFAVWAVVLVPLALLAVIFRRS